MLTWLKSGFSFSEIKGRLVQQYAALPPACLCSLNAQQTSKEDSLQWDAEGSVRIFEA